MSGTDKAEEPDELPDALIEELGLETARRQHMKEMFLSGEAELPTLEELAPLEPGEGPDIEP
jgi:hypothetical protein